MSKHAPNRLSNYQKVHEKRIRHLIDGGFLVKDAITWDATGDGYIVGEGDLICIAGIRVQVIKRLKILSGEGANATVKTVSYGYNAVLSGIGNILRYDNPHGPTHRPYDHVHRFDILGDGSEEVIDIYSEEQIPTLAQVVEELADWYYANKDAVDALQRM